MIRRICLVFILFLFLAGCRRQYDILGGKDVYLHESIQLSVDGYIIDDENEKIAWTSYDSNIATVDENGEVFGISVGETYITARYKSKFVGRIIVNVLYGAVLQVAADNSIAISESTTLDITSEIIGDGFTFDSLDSSIANVDENGKITGVSAGDTTIIIRSTYHGYYEFDITIFE